MTLTVEQLDEYEDRLTDEKQKKTKQLEQLCSISLCELNNKIISELKTPDYNFILNDHITKLIVAQLDSLYQDCSDILWALRAKILLSGSLPDGYLHFEHTISDGAIQKVCQELLGKVPQRITKVNYMKNILF